MTALALICETISANRINPLDLGNALWNQWGKKNGMGLTACRTLVEDVYEAA